MTLNVFFYPNPIFQVLQDIKLEKKEKLAQFKVVNKTKVKMLK